MKARKRLWNRFLLTGFLCSVMSLYAAPQGGMVTHGDVSISHTDGYTHVEQTSTKAIVEWSSFNIDVSEHTHFSQPSINSVILNRIDASNGISQILGNLTSDGHVFLLNPAGILFADGAKIDVGSMVATTADITDANFLAEQYNFVQDPTYANSMIINRGEITALTNGLVGLVAPGVENHGVINAHLGRVALASGMIYTLDLYGDELINFAVDGAAIEDGIENSGEIYVDGGMVQISAIAADGVVNNVVNIAGIIRANSVSEQNGRIVLSGGDVNIDGAQLLAQGLDDSETGGVIDVLGQDIVINNSNINVAGNMGGGEVHIGGNYKGGGPLPNAQNVIVGTDVEIIASGLNNGDGGEIIIWSDKTTSVAGLFKAEGGINGGNGGFIETSGYEVLNFAGVRVSTNAPMGNFGKWLLDPNEAIINGDEAIAINTALATASVDHESTTTITVNAAITWNANTTLTLKTQDGTANTTVITINADITHTGNAPPSGLIFDVADASQTIKSYSNIAAHNITFDGIWNQADSGSITTDGFITFIDDVIVADGENLALHTKNIGADAVAFPEGKYFNGLQAGSWGTLTIKRSTPQSGTETIGDGMIGYINADLANADVIVEADSLLLNGGVTYEWSTDNTLTFESRSTTADATVITVDDVINHTGSSGGLIFDVAVPATQKITSSEAIDAFNVTMDGNWLPHDNLATFDANLTVLAGDSLNVILPLINTPVVVFNGNRNFNDGTNGTLTIKRVSAADETISDATAVIIDADLENASVHVEALTLTLASAIDYIWATDNTLTLESTSAIADASVITVDDVINHTGAAGGVVFDIAVPGTQKITSSEAIDAFNVTMDGNWLPHDNLATFDANLTVLAGDSLNVILPALNTAIVVFNATKNFNAFNGGAYGDLTIKRVSTADETISDATAVIIDADLENASVHVEALTLTLASAIDYIWATDNTLTLESTSAIADASVITVDDVINHTGAAGGVVFDIAVPGTQKITSSEAIDAFNVTMDGNWLPHDNLATFDANLTVLAGDSLNVILPALNTAIVVFNATKNFNAFNGGAYGDLTIKRVSTADETISDATAVIIDADLENASVHVEALTLTLASAIDYIWATDNTLTLESTSAIADASVITVDDVINHTGAAGGVVFDIAVPGTQKITSSEAIDAFNVTMDGNWLPHDNLATFDANLTVLAGDSLNVILPALNTAIVVFNATKNFNAFNGGSYGDLTIKRVSTVDGTISDATAVIIDADLENASVHVEALTLTLASAIDYIWATDNTLTLKTTSTDASAGFAAITIADIINHTGTSAGGLVFDVSDGQSTTQKITSSEDVTAFNVTFDGNWAQTETKQIKSLTAVVFPGDVTVSAGKTLEVNVPFSSAAVAFNNTKNFNAFNGGSFGALKIERTSSVAAVIDGTIKAAIEADLLNAPVSIVVPFASAAVGFSPGAITGDLTIERISTAAETISDATAVIIDADLENASVHVEALTLTLASAIEYIWATDNTLTLESTSAIADASVITVDDVINHTGAAGGVVFDIAVPGTQKITSSEAITAFNVTMDGNWLPHDNLVSFNAHLTVLAGDSLNVILPLINTPVVVFNGNRNFNDGTNGTLTIKRVSAADETISDATAVIIDADLENASVHVEALTLTLASAIDYIWATDNTLTLESTSAIADASVITVDDVINHTGAAGGVVFDIAVPGTQKITSSEAITAYNVTIDGNWEQLSSGSINSMQAITFPGTVKLGASLTVKSPVKVAFMMNVDGGGLVLNTPLIQNYGDWHLSTITFTAQQITDFKQKAAGSITITAGGFQLPGIMYVEDDLLLSVVSGHIYRSSKNIVSLGKSFISYVPHLFTHQFIKHFINISSESKVSSKVLASRLHGAMRPPIQNMPFPSPPVDVKAPVMKQVDIPESEIPDNTIPMPIPIKDDGQQTDDGDATVQDGSLGGSQPEIEDDSQTDDSQDDSQTDDSQDDGQSSDNSDPTVQDDSLGDSQPEIEDDGQTDDSTNDPESEDEENDEHISGTYEPGAIID